jgi:hypothetical protein
MDPIPFRIRSVCSLPKATGVYALCDLDETPIYVGQSVDGIQDRVRRHLTSARSDVIANRQLDVWEIAYVWAWPVAEKRKLTPSAKKLGIAPEEKAQIELIERWLYHKYNAESPLVNGTVVQPVTKAEADTLVVPQRQRVQVMAEEEIAARRQPARRLPRQAEHFRNLLDHMLNVKNKKELRRALQAHFGRLERYYRGFLEKTQNVDTAKDEQNGSEQ